MSTLRVISVKSSLRLDAGHLLGLEFFDMSEAAVQEGVLAQLELGSKTCELPGITVQSAKTPSDKHVTVIMLASDAGPDQQSAFARIAKLGSVGGLTVQHAERQLILATPSPSGTMAHMPTLGWKLKERLEVFWQVLEHVHRYHQQGFAVGPLDPHHIPLNDELKPFLLGPRVSPLMGPFAAPETASEGRIDVSSDIFTLGKLLHFTVTQEIPADAPQDPARLDELMTFPAGLSRIIRKATMRAAVSRYGSVKALADDLTKYGRYEEVGLSHPDVTEQNLGGTSYRPPAPLGQAPKKRKEEGESPVFQPNALKKLDPFRLKPAVRFAILGLGLLVALASIALAYTLGDTTWNRILMAIGAGAVGFAAFNPGMERESVLRTIFAVFFGTAVFMGNPSPWLAKSAEQAGLRSGDMNTRLENFRALKARGEFRFSGLDLSNADLSGEQFYFVVFDQVSFRGSNLSKAEFLNVQLTGVDFTGANLAGTWFVGSPTTGVVGFDRATCSTESRLPDGWLCQNQRPMKDPSYVPPAEPAPGPFGALPTAPATAEPAAPAPDPAK